MKFQVTCRMPWFKRKYMPGMVGRATLNLTELGLVVEGYEAPEYVIGTPEIAYRVLSVRTTRTVPYSTIVSYKPGNLISSYFDFSLTLFITITSALIFFFLDTDINNSTPIFLLLGVTAVRILVAIFTRHHHIAFLPAEAITYKSIFLQFKPEDARIFSEKLAEYRAAVGSYQQRRWT